MFNKANKGQIKILNLKTGVGIDFCNKNCSNVTRSMNYCCDHDIHS